MKNSFLVIALMLIASITITTNSAQADEEPVCPDGYDEVTVTMQAYGCNYDVIFCVKCATGPVPAFVSIVDVIPYPDCNCTLPYEDVYQELQNEAMTWQFIWANLCSGLNIMPCDGSSYVSITYETWLCWKAEKIEYFGNELTHYAKCDGDAKCVQTYKFCMNNGIIERTLDEAEQSEPPSCYLQGWQITMPEDVGDVSDCFIINTACTP